MTEGEVTAATGATAAATPMVVVPGASFPTRLQERLRARYPSQASQISVANAGRSGLRVHVLPYALDSRPEKEVREIAREHYRPLLRTLGL